VNSTKTISDINLTVEEILNDYKLACESREASLLGRKEVFMGKAKFGIFGDGKEVAQIAMAKSFKKGDFRSGYYRDQTFMFAIGELNIQQYFAQLYAHTDIEADPASGGRLMNGHFATRSLDENGHWKNLMEIHNSSADVSPTAAQMPRLVGLAYASKLYRENPELKSFKQFSINGNEVAFGTIGNASTSEGIFFEAINAAGVLQAPMLMAVWDDGYGISVPNKYHTTKESIYDALQGFQREKGKPGGLETFQVKGWDYIELIKTFKKASELSRKDHVPTLVHVTELTQPQGHSTSGSHERYKEKERLQWEKEHDCLLQFRNWILKNEFAHESQLESIEQEAKELAKKSKDSAWKAYIGDINNDKEEAIALLDDLIEEIGLSEKITTLRKQLKDNRNPLKQDVIKTLKFVLRESKNLQHISARKRISLWLKAKDERNQEHYSSHLYSESDESALKVPEVKAEYGSEPQLVDGREVLQACFDAAFERDPRVVAFGEDLGKIGDVNQAFAGLQKKFGEIRITDTSIRETTIIGQGIGLALRGLRPIAEIQYLDYLIYAIQTLSDDLACLQYRTKGGQKAPLIIRTRGHRLEGVWHAGSPISMILGALRGIYVLAPRNMTQAAGFYNTMLRSDDPALIIESLNGYRLKEQLPENVGEYTVPLGKPEILREGNDITVVTYGSMCRIVMEASRQLEEETGISVEVIDVQTLLPFDIDHTIVDSLKKTNRVIFADEDVPGGAAAYMMQKVLEEQDGYRYLDSKPITVTSKEHRPAYGSDGDYFSKPNVEDIYDEVYRVMQETNPSKYPDIY
jgi:pyruvate/2-oxoglutarate/acetoin dehydrogenase E1 component/TPP-dependent pyruvate/acetoin dehydrogenase alpha subunit